MDSSTSDGPVRVLMADGKWLVPPRDRPKLGLPPVEYSYTRASEPERQHYIVGMGWAA